jgi:hypothetical protein
MADDQIIQLLEEIRDLQKQNAETLKVALQNQAQWPPFRQMAVPKPQLLAVALVAVIALGSIAVFLATALAR